MGLPHVVVRFYTNPDGRAARRTTLAVLGLLGIFYVLPPVYAALGRIYAPSLIDGRSDVLVLELPSLMVGGAVGAVLTGLVTAGAFAAFLSTSSGLTIAVAGVLSQDVTGRRWGPHRLGGVAAFRVAAAIAVVVPLLLSLPAQDVAVARTVGLAFAVTASTFAPLLMLGIWWRGLTPVGAVAGLLVGGLGSGFAVAWTLADVPLPRLGLGHAGSTRCLVGSGVLPHDGRRLPPDPGVSACPRRTLHGPPPHPRGRRAPAGLVDKLHVDRRPDREGAPIGAGRDLLVGRATNAGRIWSALTPASRICLASADSRSRIGLMTSSIAAVSRSTSRQSRSIASQGQRLDHGDRLDIETALEPVPVARDDVRACQV